MTGEFNKTAFAETFKAWQAAHTCDTCGKLFQRRIIMGREYNITIQDDGSKICPFCYTGNRTPAWQSSRRTDVFGACRDGLD